MHKHLSFFIGILLVACASREPKVIQNQSVGGALGTSYSIIYLSDKKLDFQKEIDSVFAAVNKSMSTYMPDSDISKINKGDAMVVVDTMFEEVFELSKEINTKTRGYFDPTVGALVNAWGFGPGKQLEMDSTRVDSLMRYVGFDKVKLTKARTIVKEDPDIYFDFNAAVVTDLSEHQIDNSMTLVITSTNPIGSTRAEAWDLTVYPNPVQDELFVKLQNMEVETATLNIFNGVGQLIATHEVDATGTSVRIDVSDYTTGLYSVTAEAANGERVTQKFIVDGK